MLITRSRRRKLGIVFLVSAALFYVLGEFLYRHGAGPTAAVLCWTGCFVSAGLAMVMAILDVREIRRNWVEQQRALLRESLHGLETLPGDRQTIKDTTKPPRHGLE